MSKKEPKTMRGMGRKILTGDGRKNPETAIRESYFGKKKKGKSGLCS